MTWRRRTISRIQLDRLFSRFPAIYWLCWNLGLAWQNGLFLRNDKKMARILSGVGDGCDSCLAPRSMWTDEEAIQDGFSMNRTYGIPRRPGLTFLGTVRGSSSRRLVILKPDKACAIPLSHSGNQPVSPSPIRLEAVKLLCEGIVFF